MFKLPVYVMFVLLLSGSAPLYAAGNGGNGGDEPAKVEAVAPLQREPVQPLRSQQQPQFEFPYADALIFSDYLTDSRLNVFEMIVGRVAGVWVSGGPHNYTVRIRNASGPPLVVIDNMSFINRTDSDLNSLIQMIPPQDVDHIKVIKNMAGATLYGPNAGNGVIVINTKRGGGSSRE